MYHFSFFYSLGIKQYLSAEHVLEESDISVAPPSHCSHHLVPQVPDQEPNLEVIDHPLAGLHPFLLGSPAIL